MLLDRLQFFSGLEAYGFAGGNGDFRSSARISANAGLARTHIEYTKAPQFDAIAISERALHALENGFDGHLSLGFGDAGAVDNFVDDVKLDHRSLVAREY